MQSRTRSGSKQAGAAEPDPLSPEATRRHLRAILLKVHPDHFSAHKPEQHANSEALKLLNAYLDNLAEGKKVAASTLRFFVKDGPAGGFKAVSAPMPADGSLAPLFHAFSLITDAELQRARRAGRGAGGGAQLRDSMRELLAWLQQHVAEVSRAWQEHQKLEAELAALNQAVCRRFQLQFVVYCGLRYCSPTAEHVRRKMDQLRALNSSLLKREKAGASFHGLQIWLKDGFDPALAGGRRAYVDPDNGGISLLADSTTLDQELGSLDPSLARDLALSSQDFDRVQQGLLAEAAALLGVSGAIFGMFSAVRPGHPSFLWLQRFVKGRQNIKKTMARCRTQHLSSITLVIEQENFAVQPRPYVNPHVPTWLCVSNSCSPKDLLDFLCSDAGSAAAAGAHAKQLADRADEELLRRVQWALGCRLVSTSFDISFGCANPAHSWRRAAQLLLDHAALLRASVDLSSIYLQLGNKYETQATQGVMTIPCDFSVEDLPEQLRRLKASQLLQLQLPGQAAQEPAPPPRRQGKRRREAAAAGGGGTPALLEQPKRQLRPRRAA